MDSWAGNRLSSDHHVEQRNVEWVTINQCSAWQPCPKMKIINMPSSTLSSHAADHGSHFYFKPEKITFGWLIKGLRLL
jgi:hypothetical protein